MPNNVRTQLEKTIEMKTVTQKFAQILRFRMDDLNNRLEQYVRMGFPEDIAQTYYSNYLTPCNGIISDLSRNMEREHVEFLDSIIVELKKITEIQ